jgi:predicted enzyme related to lactoylglutathione lyase
MGVGWAFERDSPNSWLIRFESKRQSGPIPGGIIPRSAPTQPIGCYFVVPSIDKASVRIQELGGKVFVPKTAVPGKGYYACCLDPEDNYFVIWASDEGASKERVPSKPDESDKRSSRLDLPPCSWLIRRAVKW